ncbi:hypothetical protein [Streptomyces sp. NPDC016626]|uniref:hypothetical protein n=1 Tax=Streptomyces sp. NPDC016626 TaxID=3364968 RepID=UPI0036FF0DB1
MTTDFPHRVVIAAALEDWWITTDLAQPFEPHAVAETVEFYLISSGYTIAPDTRTTPMHTPPRTTCDASASGLTGSLGPCILRARHDGPVHQDAHGATWWTHRTPTPPSRKAVAVSVFLTLACLASGIVSLIRGDWPWVAVAGIGALLLGREAADELAERREYHQGGLQR